MLKRHGFRFLLVGAHALAAHGRPRATQDLDVLVAPTPANARRVAAALVEFGFAKFNNDWKWFTKPYRVTMLGRLPYRIDVLTGISGVSFATAWKHRTTIQTELGDSLSSASQSSAQTRWPLGVPKTLPTSRSSTNSRSLALGGIAPRVRPLPRRLRQSAPSLALLGSDCERVEHGYVKQLTHRFRHALL